MQFKNSKENEMTHLHVQVVDFIADETGQDLIEYALAASLVGLATVATLKGLGTKISTAFTSIGTTLTTNV